MFIKLREIFKGKIFSTVLTLTLCISSVVPFQTSANDYNNQHHREHAMPNIKNGVPVAVHAGEQVRLLAYFDSVNENCIQIYNQSNNRMVAVWNNYESEEREWVSPRNTSTDTVIYLVVSRHKNTPPDGHEAWYISPFKIIDKSKSTKIGFEDAEDGDFNDAMVTVTWLK